MVDLAWWAQVYPDLVMTSSHLDSVYDPTNGTSSRGDIARIDGQVASLASSTSWANRATAKSVAGSGWLY
jgi:hypothetical protein